MVTEAMKLRCLLLGRKAMTNPDNILKSRDITLPLKVCIVKAMVFSVVMFVCESWTIEKAKYQRIDAFELRCWRRLLRVPWTMRESNSRQVDKKSRGPQGKRGLEFSRRRKGQTFFPLFIPEDYITRYPA